MSEEREQAGFNYVRLNHLISCLGMRTVRLLFRERYKNTTYMEWENGSVPLNEDFIKREGSNPALELTREQKKALASADINNWDLTLLVNILLSMGSRMPTLSQEEKNAEDEALRVLRSVRNHLDRLSDQGIIPNKDFGQQWQSAKDALLRLGAREEDVEHFRRTLKLEGLQSSTGSINNENESNAKALRDRATQLIAAGEFRGGVQLYTQALLLVGLSKQEKACLYSGRSQAYSCQVEDHTESLSDELITKYLDVAMDDANLVIQLQPKWWRGHFLEGKCFQLQELFSEAIDSFEKAHSLNPGSQEIIAARDVCRFNESVDGQDLDALFTPSITPEMAQTREEVLLLVNIYKKMMRSSDPAERGRGCVFMGHRYLTGEEVPLDEEKAAELFQKAAEVGNPDGAYNAGLCCLRGIGVKQNILKAVNYFEAAAKHPVRAGVAFIFDNEGICKAKGMLGTLYRHGVGRPRDYFKAAELFTRAALERFGVAAANLAGMLAVGAGVPRYLKRALQYQKLAVELGAGPEGMRFLARLYADFGDLTQARYWYDRAISSGLIIADAHHQRFENLLQLREQDFEELKKKLPTRVLKSEVPIHILYERSLKRHKPEWSEHPNVLDSLLEADPAEIEESRNLKLMDPKRIVAVRYCRSRFASWEVDEKEKETLGLPLIPFRTAMEGKHKQQAPPPQKIPSLESIRFVDMDPTLDQVYEGRVINLTIMEEYIDWIQGCIHSVVKDDNDDFTIICFYNFDRSDPSTKKKLGFGSRIQLMNPYLVPQTTGPAVRVDDQNSLVLVSSGEENPICRYCWNSNPGPRCSKCKKAQYCSRECQKLDWEALEHKELCKVVSNHQKRRTGINLGSLKIS